MHGSNDLFCGGIEKPNIKEVILASDANQHNK